MGSMKTLPPSGLCFGSRLGGLKQPEDSKTLPFRNDPAQVLGAGCWIHMKPAGLLESFCLGCVILCVVGIRSKGQVSEQNLNVALYYHAFCLCENMLNEQALELEEYLKGSKFFFFFLNEQLEAVIAQHLKFFVVFFFFPPLLNSCKLKPWAGWGATSGPSSKTCNWTALFGLDSASLQ